MMLLGLILLSLTLSMAANCVLAWTMHTLWGWFCVQSMGAGPTIGAWWGIAVIASLVISNNVVGLKREETKKSHTWEKPIAVILGCLVTLGIAWVFGTVLGWKA
jgi:hypothetical protein